MGRRGAVATRPGSEGSPCSAAERMLVRERTASGSQGANAQERSGASGDANRLHILKATLDYFHRSGIPTVVWVAPVNIDHLRSLGLSIDGLSRSLGTIRKLVESSGAGFVDFHALLPDGAFRDARDHVTPDGEASGATALGEVLARVILWSEPSDTPPLSNALVDESPSAIQ